MTPTLICPTCGMAYEDQRQHNAWHVDRVIARKQRRELATLSDEQLIAGMRDALAAWGDHLFARGGALTAQEAGR